MKKGKITKILVYYDVPQLFIVDDLSKNKYLCLLYDILDDGELKVIGVKILYDKLKQFINGQIDLLSIFEEQNNDNRYFDIKIEEDNVLIEPYLGNLDSSMLPKENYFYKQ